MYVAADHRECQRCRLCAVVLHAASVRVVMEIGRIRNGHGSRAGDVNVAGFRLVGRAIRDEIGRIRRGVVGHCHRARVRSRIRRARAQVCPGGRRVQIRVRRGVGADNGRVRIERRLRRSEREHLRVRVGVGVLLGRAEDQDRNRYRR